MSRTLLPLLLIAGMLPAASARADENGGELRWPTETDVEINVEFVSGSIDLEGWDLDEVRVRAHRRTREALDVEASRDAISIGIPAARFGWLPNAGEARLRIDVPRGSQIRARLHHADGEQHRAHGERDQDRHAAAQSPPASAPAPDPEVARVDGGVDQMPAHQHGLPSFDGVTEETGGAQQRKPPEQDHGDRCHRYGQDELSAAPSAPDATKGP